MLELPSLFTVVAILASLFASFYFYARRKQTYWQRLGIYSPPSHWLFGHFRDAILMKSSPPTVLGDVHQECDGKNVVGIYIMQKPFLLIRDPDIMKHIFVKDFNVFPDRYFASKRKNDPVGSTNLFSIDNPQWKYLRVKLSPAFTTGKQKKLFELMVESAENMKNFLTMKIPDDANVNIECRRLASKYTTDVISSLTFGIRTDSFQEPEPEFYVRSRIIFSQDFWNIAKLFIDFFFPKLNDYTGSVFFRDQDAYFRAVFWESMNEREKSGVKRGDLIDFLLELKNEEHQSKEFKFEDDRLLAQSAIFFIAGLETSAVTMGFTLFELAKQPDIQNRVRTEIVEKVGNASLTYERISEMNYLQQVVSETLRLYPPAPLLDRVAVEDYKIPETDIVIEKGTPVYVALPGIHRDPLYHTDPLKFDPDRFSDERKHDIKACSYMPFGEGPRICIGMRTGMLQTMVGLITILKEYEIFVNSNYNTEISKRSIFIAPANGINLLFKRNPVVH